MSRRELTEVDDVEVDYEPESYSLFDAVLEEWALWVGAVVAMVFAALAVMFKLTASPLDQFLFGAIAVVVALGAAGRVAALTDLL